jgi:hypothetical protein
MQDIQLQVKLIMDRIQKNKVLVAEAKSGVGDNAGVQRVAILKSVV